MFEVTRYEPPCIFVTSLLTDKTYIFFVGADGAVTHEEARFDGDARRVAIAYLVWKARAE
jgi:hypothetical protein